MKTNAPAYILWFLGFFGVCGVHRFYAGRWVTGIIWLMTGGLLFVGQIIDLFLIPRMIHVSNIEETYNADRLAALRHAQMAQHQAA